MRIAIVGAGISGLATAHLLHRTHEVTVFEAGARPGGHANTVRVDTEHATHHVDTGFIVFNDRNYPNFEKLLAALGVAAQPSDMSFGVSDGGDFEYNGSSPNGLFAKRAHLVTPWFHRMVADLVRFNRNARALLRAAARGPSLGHWLDEGAYSRPFVERLIVPQASAVWSADPRQMWTFPARFLVEFFANHGMLGFAKRPQWRTIVGGSRSYVEAITKPLHGARGRAGDRDRPLRRPRGALAGGGCRSASTRSCSPPTPTRRCGCSPTPPTASTRSSARSPISPTRPSCTPTGGCCRAAGARGRAGTTTCCPSRRR